MENFHFTYVQYVHLTSTWNKGYKFENIYIFFHKQLKIFPVKQVVFRLINLLKYNKR